MHLIAAAKGGKWLKVKQLLVGWKGLNWSEHMQ